MYSSVDESDSNRGTLYMYLKYFNNYNIFFIVTKKHLAERKSAEKGYLTINLIIFNIHRRS